ncbi:MAG: hypothetical protein AAF404_09505 [Pseudomonadota bacterium]
MPPLTTGLRTGSQHYLVIDETYYEAELSGTIFFYTAARYLLGVLSNGVTFEVNQKTLAHLRHIVRTARRGSHDNARGEQL